MLKKDREYQFEESIEWRIRMARERSQRGEMDLQRLISLREGRMH